MGNRFNQNYDLQQYVTIPLPITFDCNHNRYLTQTAAEKTSVLHSFIRGDSTKKFLSLLLASLLLFCSPCVFAASVDENIPSDAFEYNGHYYKVYTGECKNWEKAKEFCEQQHGYLAVISSKEENDALYQYICSVGVQTAYFGLSDHEKTDEWVWVEQESSDFTNWHTNEPNHEPGEHYAEFYWKYTDGTWNDGNFGFGTSADERSFLCEWDPTLIPAARTFPLWPLLLLIPLMAGLVFFLIKKFGSSDKPTQNYGSPEYVRKIRK